MNCRGGIINVQNPEAKAVLSSDPAGYMIPVIHIMTRLVMASAGKCMVD